MFSFNHTHQKKYGKGVCGTTTPHNIIFQFYKTICGIEVLGYATLAYDFALNKIYEPGNNQFFFLHLDSKKENE